jgi:hypothetical protein
LLRRFRPAVESSSIRKRNGTAEVPDSVEFRGPEQIAFAIKTVIYCRPIRVGFVVAVSIGCEGVNSWSHVSVDISYIQLHIPVMHESVTR